jgi:hypothetical protein
MLSECVSIFPLPSTGHGAEHIGNTSSVVLHNHSTRTTAGNSLPLLCYVTAYARMCLARVAYQKTRRLCCRECVFIGPLPSSGSIRRSIKYKYKLCNKRIVPSRCVKDPGTLLHSRLHFHIHVRCFSS